jgi:hypothetical protein
MDFQDIASSELPMENGINGLSGNAPPEPSSPKQQTRFRPYPVDWRFLPEPVLLVKDTLRYHVVQTVVAASNVKLLRQTWGNVAQSRILEPAQRAQRLFIHIPKCLTEN